MSSFFRQLTGAIDFFYKPFRRFLPLQTFRYGMSGGLNLVLDTVLYFIAFHYIFHKQFLDLGFVVVSPHIAALCVVFPITFFNGFLLNKYVAFRMSPVRGRVQLFRYGLSVSGALIANYALMKLFVETIHFYPTPSKAMINVIVTVYSYLMQKYFTFRGCSEE
ncbi:MAG: GtrA family protein [Alistipes sp.]|nr:GtrA family protein [Alistipes sp.]